MVEGSSPRLQYHGGRRLLRQHHAHGLGRGSDLAPRHVHPYCRQEGNRWLGDVDQHLPGRRRMAVRVGGTSRVFLWKNAPGGHYMTWIFQPRPVQGVLVDWMLIFVPREAVDPYLLCVCVCVPGAGKGPLFQLRHCPRSRFERSRPDPSGWSGTSQTGFARPTSEPDMWILGQTWALSSDVRAKFGPVKLRAGHGSMSVECDRNPANFGRSQFDIGRFLANFGRQWSKYTFCV